MTIADDLGLLMQNHDDEPQAAADQLRKLAALDVPADQLGRFTWLINHVIGEKFNLWGEAHALIVKATAQHASLPLPVLRYTAVSAYFSGDLLAGLALERRMMQLGLPGDQAATAVRAGALNFAVTHERVLDVAAALHTVIESVDRWDQASAADALVAASLSNVVSALLDEDDETVGHSDVRDAMIHGASAARTLWRRAGTWVNEERADYLCSLVFNRLGEPAKALEAAERGRQLIETNGSEDVDRAFLMLESARALAGLSRKAEGLEYLKQAVSISQQWDDESLRKWFDGKAQPVEELVRQIARGLRNAAA